MARASRQELRMACGDKRTFSDLLKNNAGYLGIQKWKGNLFFDIRGENSPSVQVNDGWCYDHGTGERYELIDLIARARNLNLSDLDHFKEAAAEAELMITGKQPERSYSGVTNEAYNSSPEYLPPVDRNTISVWYKNKKNESRLFNNLLDGLMRSSTLEEKELASSLAHFGLSIEEKISRNSQEKYLDKRLLLPYIDKDGQVYSYGAYRRESAVKILKRKDGRPSLAGEHLIKGFDKNKRILWSEGDGDYATGLGLGIQTVTCGSASMRITPFLDVLAGFEVVFLPDNDEAGSGALARWIIEVNEWNKVNDVKIKPVFIWWSQHTWNKAKKTVIEKWRKELLKNGMIAENLSDEAIMSAVGGNFEDVIVTELPDVLKKGYDLVDFASDRGEIFNEFVNFFTTPISG